MKKVLFTIVGITVLLFFAFFMIGSIFTDKYIQEEIDKLRSTEVAKTELISQDSLKNLPLVLKKYFDYSIKNWDKNPLFVKTEQSSLIKTDEKSTWKEITAEQYYSVQKPGFVWNGKIEMSPFIWARAIDSYVNNKGKLLIKLFSTMKISDATGKELSQSGLFRYLSESVFFPTALLPSENLEWRFVEQGRVKATLKDGNYKIEADFYFNSLGQIIKIETNDKFRTTNVGFMKNNFFITFSDYKEFDGYMIPTYAETNWLLENNEFKYGKYQITKVEYIY